MPFDSRLLSGIGVLSAVIEAGSFSRASETLGLTPSAVSRAVSRLEDRVGLRIFHRSARSIALTDEGRRFYQSVAPHLSRIEEAAIEAAGTRAHVAGRLRITTDGAFGPYVLAPRLQALLERHPELAIEMAVRDRVGDLVADGFDIAVHFGEPQRSSLICRQLLRTRVVTCASPEYVARHGLPTHPSELEQQHRCLLLRDFGSGGVYEWEFLRGNEAVPVNASGRLTVNDTAGLVGACLGGAGVAQLLSLYARDMIADGRLVQLLPDWAEETFPLYVYHNAMNTMSARMRAFLDFLTEITP